MSRALHWASCATMVALTACSSSTEPTPTTLTNVEARQVAGVYASLALGGRETFTTRDSVTASCPKGGTVRTTALNAANSNPVRAAVVFTTCIVEDAAGKLWSFTSVPKLDLSITAAIADTSITAITTTTGTMRVESATVNGTCYIDTRLETVLRLTAAGGMRIRQSGQVCGQAIDTTFTAVAP